MTNVIISKKKHIRIALYKNYKTFLSVSPILEPFYDKKKTIFSSGSSLLTYKVFFQLN